jgi:hypothetical protein
MGSTLMIDRYAAVDGWLMLHCAYMINERGHDGATVRRKKGIIYS